MIYCNSNRKQWGGGANGSVSRAGGGKPNRVRDMLELVVIDSRTGFGDCTIISKNDSTLSAPASSGSEDNLRVWGAHLRTESIRFG